MVKFKFGRGYYEYDDTFEVNFTMTTVNVTVGERRLNARWTPELAQDIQAFHNLDAEAELTALLSEQMTQELDQAILRSLREQRIGLSHRYVVEKIFNFKPFKFGR